MVFFFDKNSDFAALNAIDSAAENGQMPVVILDPAGLNPEFVQRLHLRRDLIVRDKGWGNIFPDTIDSPAATSQLPVFPEAATTPPSPLLLVEPWNPSASELSANQQIL